MYIHTHTLCDQKFHGGSMKVAQTLSEWGSARSFLPVCAHIHINSQNLRHMSIHQHVYRMYTQFWQLKVCTTSMHVGIPTTSENMNTYIFAYIYTSQECSHELYLRGGYHCISPPWVQRKRRFPRMIRNPLLLVCMCVYVHMCVRAYMRVHVWICICIYV